MSLHHEAPTTYVIPIAGDIDGRHTDEALELLKAADVGAGKEGLRVTLNGGMYDETKQQAIIEFICDPDRTGLEGDDAGKRKREDEDEDDEKKEKDGRSLKFVSYDRDNAELHVLRLEWKTKYACKGASVEDPAPEQGSGWGFFTWFIIMYAWVVSCVCVYDGGADCAVQLVPGCRSILDLWFVARLQPLRRKRVLNPSPPLCPLPIHGRKKHILTPHPSDGSRLTLATAAGTCSRTATRSGTFRTC